MTDPNTTIEQLKRQVKEFVTQRNWEQFHTPKSLAMAIAVEAAELMEHFLWCENQAKEVFEKKREQIEDEIADITILLINFCSQNNIDLSRAIECKMKKNAVKYPVGKCFGRTTKYTEL